MKKKRFGMRASAAAMTLMLLCGNTVSLSPADVNGEVYAVRVSAVQPADSGFRTTLTDLNLQTGDAVNVTVQGDAGDTVQVHFYYIGAGGQNASALIGVLGGTVLSVNCLRLICCSQTVPF